MRRRWRRRRSRGDPSPGGSLLTQSGTGGTGGYGGGGGGGGWDTGDGGQGGFGGGGGAGAAFAEPFPGGGGGDGGFGGGGGSGPGGDVFGEPGEGGTFAGNATDFGGGGGAGLGGAIFGHQANITISNSTFTRNAAVRGVGGGEGAQNGADAGGAIFTVAGSLTVVNSTVAGNESTGDGAGITVYKPTTGEATSLVLRNTIVAANSGRDECFVRGGVSTSGWNNLVTPHPLDDTRTSCPGITQTGDPLLAPLTLAWPGRTPTMALNAATRPSTPAIRPWHRQTISAAPPVRSSQVSTSAPTSSVARPTRSHRWPTRRRTRAECERMDEQPSHRDVELGRRSGRLGHRPGQLRDVVVHDRRGTGDRADRRMRRRCRRIRLGLGDGQR